MARRSIGWVVVCAALATLVAAYLTDTKERRGRLSPPPVADASETPAVGRGSEAEPGKRAGGSPDAADTSASSVPAETF